MTLSDRARNILTIMDSEQEPGRRPIAFIAHSMGGLLVKELLRTAGKGRSQVWKRTRGVMFLATPHTGADWAKVVNTSYILSTIYRPSIAVKELEPNSDYLLTLKGWYSKSAVKRAIRTSVLYEAKSSGLLAGIIVDATSANPDVPKVLPIAVDHDHHSISRPSFKNDIVVGQVHTFLEKCFPPWPWNLFGSR